MTTGVKIVQQGMERRHQAESFRYCQNCRAKLGKESGTGCLVCTGQMCYDCCRTKRHEKGD